LFLLSQTKLAWFFPKKYQIMNMKKIVLSVLLLSALTAVVLIACKKDQSGNGTMLKIRLTDNPVAAEEVNVDIELVRVKFREDSIGGWTDLQTNAGVYNLLGLQNGVDTLLATGVIPTDEVKEIRLVLGDDNSIKVNGIVYPLTIPSGSESGLKIKINKRLNGSLDSLLIDFDAALSILQTGAGDYKLKPVLKIK
jgi:hypothetical protein